MIEYNYLCFLITLNISITVLRWVWEWHRSDIGYVSSLEFQYSLELLRRAIITAIENDNTSDSDRQEYKQFLEDLSKRPNIEVKPRNSSHEKEDNEE